MLGRLVVLALAAAACRAPRSTLPVDPGVTFAAHRDGDGFVVDRTRAGETGVLAARGRLHDPDAPSFVLRVGDEARTGLWIVGHTRVLARDGTSNRGPRVGEVLSAWDDGAIRLTLYPRSGTPLETDTFHAVGGRVLARSAGASGAYRAALRDTNGAEVGWLRVDADAPRAYDAVLPERVDDAVAAAAAAALDAELGWIAEHASGN
ncbi:MAG TPA: hypothetical protein VKU61_04320 [Candidatus Binatia bacterium]|nr:hypothetical protein [Candidatus Binatia bacterium]